MCEEMWRKLIGLGGVDKMTKIRLLIVIPINCYCLGDMTLHNFF